MSIFGIIDTKKLTLLTKKCQYLDLKVSIFGIIDTKKLTLLTKKCQYLDLKVSIFRFKSVNI